MALIGADGGVALHDEGRCAMTAERAAVRAAGPSAPMPDQVIGVAGRAGSARGARVSTREHVVRVAGQLLVILLAIAAWAWFSATATGHTGNIATPVDTFRSLWRLSGTAGYWSAVGDTLTGYAVGLAISFVAGAPIGLAIGFWRRARQSTRFVLDFLRTIPPIALIPLVLLELGPTRRAEVVLIVIAVLPLLIVQGIYAAKEVDDGHREVARSYRLGRVERFRRVYLPSVLPSVLTGLRVASTAALLIAIASELLANVPGIGMEMSTQQLLIHSPHDAGPLFAYVLTSGILGLLLNGIVLQLRRHTVGWHPSVRGGRQ